MKLWIDSSYPGQNEANDRVLQLYRNDPSGCYFQTRMKIVNWELLLSATTVYQVEVVGLSDWGYEDIYSLMPVIMNLPMDHIPLFTGFLEKVRERAGWCPLSIGDRFVVFDVVSQDPKTRTLVQHEVERFQDVNGLEYVTSRWGGWWIGAS